MSEQEIDSVEEKRKTIGYYKGLANYHEVRIAIYKYGIAYVQTGEEHPNTGWNQHVRDEIARRVNKKIACVARSSIHQEKTFIFQTMENMSNSNFKNLLDTSY